MTITEGTTSLHGRDYSARLGSNGMLVPEKLGDAGLAMLEMSLLLESEQLTAIWATLADGFSERAAQ